MPSPYLPLRPADSRFLDVRGWRYHLLQWGDLKAGGLDADGRPPLVLVHGWMDVAASFQFVVDAIGGERCVIAPDWRGFGLTEPEGGVWPDSYAFADYLGDLDALLDHLLPGGEAVDLVGHSMGGNVAMVYAGVRPQRVRRLVNLEGFGMPGHEAEQAPGVYARWLDSLKVPQALRPYDSLQGVAERLCRNDPRLPQDKAAWLAGHWSREDGQGQWRLLADAAHKRPHAMTYRVDEVRACWRRIEAPLMWVEGAHTDTRIWWGDRYPREEFERRLAVVKPAQRHTLDCGHMLHHDQPEALAQLLTAFLDT